MWRFLQAFNRFEEKKTDDFTSLMHIVVEVTMNMAEYTSSWQSAAGAAVDIVY